MQCNIEGQRQLCAKPTQLWSPGSLHFTAVHFNAVHCIALHCTALHYIAVHFNVLHRTAPLGLALGSQVGVVTNMQRGVCAIGGTVHCIVRSVQRAVYNVQRSAYSVHCIFCGVQCVVHSVQ